MPEYKAIKFSVERVPLLEGACQLSQKYFQVASLFELMN